MYIYVVKHLYDNGESYEDYREYEDYEMFSTYSRANQVYWIKVSDPDGYEGKFQLIEWELDTQDQQVLEESPWLTCTPSYWVDPDYECEPDEDSWFEDNYYWNGAPKYPEANIQMAWELVDWESEHDIPIMAEKQLIQEYLTSEGANYKAFKKVDEEIQARRIEALDSELTELLTL